MRFRSTPATVIRREVTFLAVIECILSVSIYAAIGVYFNTLTHVAAAVAIAPLFLLRTRYSIRLGIAIWKRLLSKTDDFEVGPLLLVIVPPLMFCAVGIRVLATAVGLVRYPRVTISAIPRNWSRQALCTDFFFTPEVMPGESSLAVDVIKFSYVIEALREIPSDASRDPKEAVWMSAVMSLVLVAGYVPSILFRVSFKATSFVYLPLIWVAGTTVRGVGQLKYRLTRFKEGELEKVRRWAASFVLVLAASKAALIGGAVERAFLVSKLGSENLADLLLAASPWWLLMLATDGALTFFLFFYSEAILARLNAGLTVRATAHSAIISTAAFLRGIIAIIAVISCFSFALSALLYGLV